MLFEPASFLSFILKPTGEVLAAMPDDEEFSLQQLSDYVAGSPEVLCETADGYLLFHNRNDHQPLTINSLASSICAQYAPHQPGVTGRAFLAHRDHVPAFWRRTLAPGTPRNRRIA